jgi:hypothetical protein
MTDIRQLGVFAIMVLSIVSAACSPCGYDGPYKGRVIDAETGTPIEGVVALGVWYKELPSPGGTVGSYYDAQETVTDKNGDFEIKGQGLQILSTVSGMNILVFKAGYQYIGPGLWYSLKFDGGLLRNKAKWEKDRAIIPIKRLTTEERNKRHVDKEMLPDNKQHLLIKELNKEYKEIGISLYPEKLP